MKLLLTIVLAFGLFIGRAPAWAQPAAEDEPLIGLWAFRPLGGLELDTLALIERPESGRLDRAVVDENVRTAAVHGDEAVALFGIEPLNGSLRHETSPSICIRNRTSRSRLLLDARSFLTPTQSSGGVALTTQTCNSDP